MEVIRNDNPSKKTKKATHACEVHHNSLKQDPENKMKNEEKIQNDDNTSHGFSLDANETVTLKQVMDGSLSQPEQSSSKPSDSNNPVGKMMTEKESLTRIENLSQDLGIREATENDLNDNAPIPPSPSLLSNDATKELNVSACNEDIRSFYNSKDTDDFTSKIPSVSATRSAYLPYLYNKNSDVVSSEGMAIKTSAEMYKFAFDESMSDQSGTESKSPSPEKQFFTGTKSLSLLDESDIKSKSPIPVDPELTRRLISPVDPELTRRLISPVDPELTRRLISPVGPKHSDVSRPKKKDARPEESNIPHTLGIHEINVYEADSDADAGSEDLEMIPRESEASKNKSKHLSENELSLAVEFLRANENNLPFDAEFKIKCDDHEELSDTESSRNDEKATGTGETTGQRQFGTPYRRYLSPATWSCCNIM